MDVDNEFTRWELVNPAVYPSSPPALIQSAQQAAKHLEQMDARIIFAVKASPAEKLLGLEPSADLALHFQVSYLKGDHHIVDAAQWMPALRFRRLFITLSSPVIKNTKQTQNKSQRYFIVLH